MARSTLPCDVEEVRGFISALAICAKDEEVAGREKLAAEAIKTMDRGGNIRADVDLDLHAEIREVDDPAQRAPAGASPD
mgnify:CR=1 FL=1|tara:strand:+ start:1803 stop:2039 length:237 start_codon:yes stop_codon:yes gene_type:complete